MPVKQSTKEHMDHLIKSNPVYLQHIAENGKPELVQDPEEAYEVAHGTKRLEERYSRTLGRLGQYYETGVFNKYDKDHDPESDHGREEQHAMAVSEHKDGINLRIEANKLGDAYSTVHKNNKKAA